MHVFPREHITFIRTTLNTSIIFNKVDICRAEQLIELTRKVGSTTAKQAMEPHNIARREMFWSTPQPTGIIGTPRQLLIDIDEMKICLGTCNRSFGKILMFKAIYILIFKMYR